MSKKTLERVNRVRKYPRHVEKVASHKTIISLLKDTGTSRDELQRALSESLLSFDEITSRPLNKNKTQFSKDLKTTKASLERVCASLKEYKTVINAHFDLNGERIKPKDMDLLVKTFAFTDTNSFADLYLQISRIVIDALSNERLEANPNYKTRGKNTHRLITLFAKNPKIERISLYCTVFSLWNCLASISDEKLRTRKVLDMLKEISIIESKLGNDFICGNATQIPTKLQEIQKITALIARYSQS